MLRALEGRDNKMVSESFEKSPAIFTDILSYAMEKNLNCSITADSSTGTLFAEDEQGSSIKVASFPITEAEPGEEDFEEILLSVKKAVDAFVETLEPEEEPESESESEPESEPESANEEGEDNEENEDV